MKSFDINIENGHSAIFDDPNSPDRMLSVPSSAFGSMRRELINTLGIEHSKGFLLRYGWDCGVTDFHKMKDLEWENEIDIILAGPKMHSLNRHVLVEPIICNFDFEKKTLHFEGEWINSYEALEHLKLFSVSDHPECLTLVGYASGYLSSVMGKKVIVKETKCTAMGHDKCHWVAKTIDLWNGEDDIEEEFAYYETNNIGDELEETYGQLRKERDNLSKTYQVHQILVRELIYETGLDSIISVLYETTSMPVMIENVQFENYALRGISQEQANQYSYELKSWVNFQKRKRKLQHWEMKDTQFVDISPNHKRLITPIYIHQSVFAYCSFLYNEETDVKDVDKMVLEQAALACSLQLLNERTRFITEQRMRGSFLEDILNKRIGMSEIAKRAHYIDFQLGDKYFMISINGTTDPTKINHDSELNDQFMNGILNHLKNNRVSAMLSQKGETIVILISESTILQISSNKEKFCKDLLSYCSKLYPWFKLKMGVSSSSATIEEASSLYDESLSSLKVTSRNQNIIFFDSLGLIGMLLETKNLDTIRKFAYKVLGNLIEEDKNMELTKTLYHYLENGSNVHKTARAMNFSISGLRYRLGRLNEILQLDINTPYIKHEIYLALQSLIVLGELEID